MGKNDTYIIIGALFLFGYMFLGGSGEPAAPTVNGGGNVDLCQLVDGTASFTGQRMFLTGTAIPTEYVRVVRMGSIMDLGQVSMDSGTLSVSPKGNYELYYGENGSTYYTAVESYTAPCQDSTDNKVGILCQIDTAPTITVFDENGQVQSGGSNAQSIAASDIVDLEIKVKANADTCYGNPGAPTKNAICFDYNSTVYDSIKANTAAIAAPYSISSAKGAGLAESCFALDLLADTESQIITVTIDASSTEPGTDHNITIKLEDVAFDLDQDSLEKIWGFEDESNNNLGASAVVQHSIDVS